MVAYSNVSASLESDLTIGVPMAASTSAALWGTWRTRHSPHTNYGPQESFPPPPEQTIDFSSLQLAEMSRIPSGFNQCIFIRYYTMRVKLRPSPKAIRAGAGPYDLSPGDDMDDTFSELLIQSDAESALSEDDDLEEEEEDIDLWQGVVIRNTPSV